jgi:hypothetical protein
MKYKKLVIEYGNDNMPVEYNLLDYDIVQRWAERLLAAQNFPYPIDNPDRFYGFDPLDKQINDALTQINSVCDTIENFKILIDRRLTDINDQDTLNYFHHIFEEHHGLLDNQSRRGELEVNLCNLNILVHKCENIQRGAKPRHVVTYFGLPKTKLLFESDYQFFTNNYLYGTVYLNYAEIGKTIEDLATDNDQYIKDEAFQPFRHYSADFNVKFYNTTNEESQASFTKIKIYYDTHQSFFLKRGLERSSDLLKPGTIPIATMAQHVGLEEFGKRQFVKSVKIYE